jgi:hypothetical protein
VWTISNPPAGSFGINRLGPVRFLGVNSLRNRIWM